MKEWNNKDQGGKKIKIKKTKSTNPRAGSLKGQKTDKPLARLNKKKRDGTQINKMRSEKRVILIDSAGGRKKR